VIYAIRFGYLGFLKFGVSANPAVRITHLQIAAPVRLELIATADWPDKFERRVHQYLHETRLEGEWFKGGDDERSTQVLDCMQDQLNGQRRFLDAYAQHMDAVRALVAEDKQQSKLRKRRMQRMAWWMGVGATQSSCARYDFDWDSTISRWMKSGSHRLGANGHAQTIDHGAGDR
jgi:hypothetical protein